MALDEEAIQRAAVRVFEAYGGRERFEAEVIEEWTSMNRRWEQDTGRIGRILRAHLFVEHYLGEHIKARNPRLGSMDDARLSFAQKISLIGADDHVQHLVPGIRRLNAIRNRLAHSLEADVNVDDAAVFLGLPLFRAMRERSGAPLETDPLAVLEAFALLAGSSLAGASSKLGRLIRDAFLQESKVSTDRDER